MSAGCHLTATGTAMDIVPGVMSAQTSGPIQPMTVIPNVRFTRKMKSAWGCERCIATMVGTK
jgi:hypothetical protein